MKKRIFCMLISILILVPFIISCSDSQKDKTADTSETESTALDEEKLDSLDYRKTVSDNLPEENFNGSAFRVVTEEGKLKDLYIEEATGDLLEDVIYNRNALIEERYNIKFDMFIKGDYIQTKQTIEKTVASDDSAFELISHHVVSSGGLVLKKLMYNWQDIEYIDFSRPWWSSSTIDDLTYNDITFLAVGDFAISAMTATYCMYYNKVLAENYNLGDLYDVVNSGAWTIDKLISTVRDIYVDVNNNNAKDQNDFYGYAMTNGSAVNTFLWAFNNPIFTKNTDGSMEYVYKTEKMNNIINRVYELLTSFPGSYCEVSSNNSSYAFDMYRKDLVIMVPGMFSTALSWRDVETDFGIIPYPKWNDAQTDYYTMADGSHSVLSVPINTINTEYVGIITEVLCAESWKTVIPAYYDVALKVKGARDEESIAMLDMIFAKRVFDFGYVYDNFVGVSFILQRMMSENNVNFESYYKKNEKPAIKHYGKIINVFENY